MDRYLAGSLAAASPTPLAKWAGLLVVVALSSGCGQKGALYMQPAVPASAASAPAR